MNINEFISYLNEMNIFPSEDQLNQLSKYYELIVEYNKKMNLTGITDKQQVYLKHFYDSLTLAKIIDLSKEETLCDIGSGAGLPGIVIKILFPNLKITLIDSLNKRIKFLNIVIKELDLKNCEAIHCRIEEYGKINREKFDIVTARAVADTNQLLEYSIPLLKVNKFFVAMKGKIDSKENYQGAIKKLNCSLYKTIEFKLPNENSDRSLLCFKKISKTPKIFPRKFIEIKNKPL